MLKHYRSGKIMIAGCDEAGRGCLAGPVVAAAVILSSGFKHPMLNDSKKMKEADRELVRKAIMESATAWAIGICNHEEIDRINILNASILAMHKAVEKLTVRPAKLIIDGNKFHPVEGIAHQCVVGGDGIYTQIAAASVLAKTERDRIMNELHHAYPQYGWDKNKAYGTAAHREAIFKYGRSPFHRKSFKTVFQMSLEL